MAARTFRKKKNNNKVVSFSALLFMFPLTWIIEKELERVTENKDEFRRKKNMEIQSGGEKMRNASGQQGENGRQSCKTTARERQNACCTCVFVFC